jgi:peptide/nickel transport system permease protein
MQTAQRLIGPYRTTRRSRVKPWLSRIGLYAFTVWAVLTLNFLLPRAMPGDPILEMQDPSSNLYVTDVDARARLAAYYGLDRPLLDQYVHYLAGLATGDLGWSIRQSTPVLDLIRSHLPWTLLLTIPSLLFASVVTVLAGAHSAWRRGSPFDRLLLVAFSILRTIPIFFLGMLALMVFSVNLGWLPLAGANTPFRVWQTPWEQAGDVFQHWLLPASLLTIETISGRYLLMRNSMVSVLGEDYMFVARAKGLPDRTIEFRHGLRNAILPFVTAFSAQLGFAVAGAIFIETLFAYPGMGRLMFDAVAARDYPVLEGTFLVVALSVLTVNLLTELVYGWLDPRVRPA